MGVLCHHGQLADQRRAAQLVGGVSRGIAATRRQTGLEPGYQGAGVLGRPVPRNMVRADRMDTGGKTNLRQSGCERDLMTHWQCSWQTGARSWPARGQARLLGTGARSRQGSSPGKAARSRDGQQGRGWRGWSTGCAVQPGGRTFRGPGGQCVHLAGPVRPRLIQKEGEPPPSREEETSCHQLSKHQQMQQSGCLLEVSETA